MRLKKTNILAGLSLTFGAMFLVYVVLDSVNQNYADNEVAREEIVHLETKLSNMENDLELNQKTIDKIRETVNEIKKQQVEMKSHSQAVKAKGRSPVNKTFASIAKSDLAFASGTPSTCDIDMADVYDELPFDNPDGGVWKQGWEVKYDPQKVLLPENKLRVFVMPHSHNDPGWIKTFEDYYKTQTQHILTNMMNKLKEDPRRKFVWAEISFFALWWNQQKASVQQDVIKLLKDGQLELVTGGWVMNDEANSYYYAIIEQLLLGHEWCKKNLDNYKPNNGWAIDPFGLSSTMAYLLKRIGFDNMLIQRTHYAVKKRLAQTQDLEFMWRQHWDHDKSTEILTHMMPFYSYDVPHTCGPDPKICCQFDFARLPGSRYTCPWRVPPRPINDGNVGERSGLILDQWRKKATLYKTNVLLVPLGDDFRYQTNDEIDKQFINFQKIFDYVNSHTELNVEASFGTLQDYFTAVRKESGKKSGAETGMFKSLKGDFFTYCDREDNYWSGYYTSRPFYKSMDRILEGYLRAAEILFSMAWAEMEYVGSDVPDMANALMLDLVIARQHLSLFQHHDGVTGTAKNHVVVDYGNKMLQAIQNCQRVMSLSSHYLLSSAKAFYKADLQEQWFDLDDFRDSHDSIGKQTVMQPQHPDMPLKLVLFNSHARHRSETVSVRISEAKLRVYSMISIDGEDEEESIPIQISPVFDNEGQILNSEYELNFLAQVKGFGLKTYYVAIARPEEGNNPDLNVAKISIHNSVNHPFQAQPFDDPEVYEKGDSFSLQNGYVKANFNADGMLQSIMTLDDNIETMAKLQMIIYGTKRSGDKSGAYLFMPDSEARPLHAEKPLVRIIDGKILSYVEVFTPWMRHVVYLKSSPGPDGTGLEIRNDVDIRDMNNAEVGMRITTDIKSGDDFFTDLNGFQMIKRKRMLQKLPLQANYYPVPSMLYIQDEASRLTLVSRQSVGGSSLKSGEIEVLMDRRLAQDDNRGLFQGVQDNKVTPHVFYLALERKIKNCQSDEPSKGSQSYPTLLSLQIRHGLINPMYRMIYVSQKSVQLSHTYDPVDQDLSCDIDVVTVRTMMKAGGGVKPADNSVLILHRQGFNACYKPIGMTCSTNGGKISVENLFPELFGEQMKQASLTLMYDGLQVQKGFTVSINPMEVYSFLLTR